MRRLAEPVAVLLVAVLHFLGNRDDPWAVVNYLKDQIAPGSYLVISHPAKDISSSEMGSSMRAYNESSPLQLTPRTFAEVSRFFDGLELVEPGLVQLNTWRPATLDIGDHRELANYGGVARKP